ncbi:terminase small subunit [Kurthia sp. Dielmo]|uniref:terminase small subunit n=1 Tax=Kurthia sp. Dielmo TaxID=1033738 RepID=UPI001C93C929|nr:terminase small subunit [Kurthia sp. Dielmo]
MAEKYELAKVDYDNGMKYKDIAEKYGVTLNTVKSWKTRKWNKIDSEDDESVHTKEKGVHTKKKQTHTEESTRERLSIAQESLSNENSDLTDKQWLFCRYYTKYWNATKAYQKVYDCDYMQAMSNGSRLLRNDKIRAEISAIKQDIADGIMIESRAVLQKWIDIAFADISDYVAWGTEKRLIPDVFVGRDANDKKVFEDKEIDVNYVHLKSASNIDTSIVTEIKEGKDGVTVKLADKMKALDFLTKYMDLLNDNELKQLKIEKELIAIRKANGDDHEEYEDDGFIEALKGVEVDWDAD